MSTPEKSFYITGGAVDADAPCYVERRADDEIYRWLLQGEFCYVLTSRQMGKSSLMVRTARRLRQNGSGVVGLDLMRLGVNLTAEQWYDGLLTGVGGQLALEDELESYSQKQRRLGPLERFFSALRDVVLVRRQQPLVIFIDEIDMVRGLHFSTDDFLAAIGECFDRRSTDSEFDRLTFCLLGVSTPSELIRNPHRTPFKVGRRIELTDFTKAEAAPLAQRLSTDETSAKRMLQRIFYWTNGHPYLTQRLCQAVAEAERERSRRPSKTGELIDSHCERLFLSASACNQEPNLAFVRDWILRTKADLTRLLELYQQVYRGESVRDDEPNDLIHQLRLSGIVKAADGHLLIRNRIYGHVFNQDWINSKMPDAELEKKDGERVRVKGACSIGRSPGSDVVLTDPEVSRRHALIQAQHQYEFWLLDLGSRNGTYVNDLRVNRPVLLRDADEIDIGPFRLIFRQSKAVSSDHHRQTDDTVPATKQRQAK